MNGPRDYWVFGYGSLMWNPGFPHVESRRGTVYGYHRAFCLTSHMYRGTPERPGLVLGLDKGGSCLGMAYRVAPEDAEEVRAYLHEREMIHYVYRDRNVRVRLEDGRAVTAHTHVADRDHDRYAGKLPQAELVRLVLQGCGSKGTCLDYLENTVRHLDEMGIADGPLHRLLADVRAANARSE